MIRLLNTITEHFNGWLSEPLKRGIPQWEAIAGDKRYVHCHKIVRLCWRFIRNATKNYIPAGKYVIDSSMELLIYHVPIGVHAIDTLVQALKGNSDSNQVINNDKALHEQIVTFAFGSIKVFGLAEQFLDFIANACSSTGAYDKTRYPATCAYVLSCLGDEAHRHVLPERRVKNGSIEIMSDRDSGFVKLSKLGHAHELDISKYINERARGHTTMRHRAVELPSLEYQCSLVRLFTKTCTPDNKPALMGLIPIDEVLCGISDESIADYKLRECYCRVFKELYIGLPDFSIPLQEWTYPSQRKGLGSDGIGGARSPRTRERVQYCVDVQRYWPVVMKALDSMQRKLDGDGDRMRKLDGHDLDGLNFTTELLRCMLSLLYTRFVGKQGAGDAEHSTGTQRLVEAERLCRQLLTELSAKQPDPTVEENWILEEARILCLYELCRVLTALHELSLDFNVHEFVTFYNDEVPQCAPTLLCTAEPLIAEHAACFTPHPLRTVWHRCSRNP